MTTFSGGMMLLQQHRTACFLTRWQKLVYLTKYLS